MKTEKPKQLRKTITKTIQNNSKKKFTKKRKTKNIHKTIKFAIPKPPVFKTRTNEKNSTNNYEEKIKNTTTKYFKNNYKQNKNINEKFEKRPHKTFKKTKS